MTLHTCWLDSPECTFFTGMFKLKTLLSSDNEAKQETYNNAPTLSLSE